MRRVAITGLIYFVAMNATVVVLDVAGFFDAMNVHLNISASNSLTEAVTTLENIDLEGGLLDTLVTLFLSIVKIVEAVLQSLYAGPQMLIQLGIPSEIIMPYVPIVTIIIGLAVIYYASGRE